MALPQRQPLRLAAALAFVAGMMLGVVERMVLGVVLEAGGRGLIATVVVAAILVVVMVREQAGTGFLKCCC